MAKKSTGGEPGKPSGHVSRPKEFERFEDLARKLLRVPKSELDEKLDEERRASTPSPSAPGR
jgi:hypothetical protein